MIDKNNTVFVERYEYKNANDLLNEILRRTEGFCYYNSKMADNVRMTAKQYYEILNYKSDLIKKKEDGYYILCMKVVF